MTLKMEVTCSRCKKTHSQVVHSAAEADAFATLEAKKTTRLKEIGAFLSEIPPEELPDFMVIGAGETGLVHMTLCNPEGAKRSCRARIAELLVQADTLDERKPRSPNKKSLAGATAAVNVLSEALKSEAAPIPLTVEKK